MSAETQGELEQAARATIRALVEDWVLLRDAGRWEEFTRVWHSDGWMTATWFQGHFSEFIAASRHGFENGVQIAHFLGGHTCDVVDHRAVAQTKMKIEQRGVIDDIVVDVVCTGRFYDFLEQRDGVWGIVRRQVIYERDRLDVVDPATQLSLSATVLEGFPYGYRFLGYLQESAGEQVRRDLPGLVGPGVERLYAEGREWLDGSPAPGDPLAPFPLQ